MDRKEEAACMTGRSEPPAYLLTLLLIPFGINERYPMVELAVSNSFMAMFPLK
jgi:hypothetical protein